MNTSAATRRDVIRIIAKDSGASPKAVQAQAEHLGLLVMITNRVTTDPSKAGLFQDVLGLTDDEIGSLGLLGALAANELMSQ